MKRVQFVEMRENLEFVPVKDHYALRPKGRAQFLQRWAWGFLAWVGALEQAVDQKKTYTRHVIDTADVMQRLMEQRAGLLGYDEEPKELLIGAEDFADLMGHPAIHNAMAFTCEYHSGRQIMGLKVRVIPWMRGMLVMPARERA